MGNIYKGGSEPAAQYLVQSIDDLAKIINHFDRYPLITQKLADYLLFKQVFNLMLERKHLTMEGLRRIVGIKASINLGLSEQLKTAFPEITSSDRPLITNQRIPDPN